MKSMMMAVNCDIAKIKKIKYIKKSPHLLKQIEY